MAADCSFLMCDQNVQSVYLSLILFQVLQFFNPYFHSLFKPLFSPLIKSVSALFLREIVTYVKKLIHGY